MAIFREQVPDTPLLGIEFQDAAICGMVIYDAQTPPSQILGGQYWYRWCILGGGCDELNREPERAAVAQSAVNTDLATHQLCKLFTDGKPQPRASVLAGDRAVGLAERLKQMLLRFRGESNAGIAALKPYRGIGRSLVCQLDRNDHLTLLRKLNGV